MNPLITQTDIDTYQRDGVVIIRGLFKDHVDAIRAGIERNMADPGPYAAENLHAGEGGRFFDDYCNWTRIAEFGEVISKSPAAEVAADLMGANRVQVFHDHILVKEPGTSKPTPWHQDGPYYFVDGIQNISFWSPMDTVQGAGLRCVAGSHLWEKPVLPKRWLADTSFYPDENAYMPVPDPDAEGMDIRELVDMMWLPRLEAHKPELIFISAGFDAHREDDLGQMGLVEQDYAWMTQRIKDVALRHAQGRIVSCLEGGYNLSALGRSVEAHLRVLADI